MHGKATDRMPAFFAASRQLEYAAASCASSVGVGPPPRPASVGPVTCSTRSHGRWKARVRMGGVPAASGEPRASMASTHAARRRGPAARWMRLSTHLHAGWKQPRPSSLAALTIASTASTCFVRNISRRSLSTRVEARHRLPSTRVAARHQIPSTRVAARHQFDARPRRFHAAHAPGCRRARPRRARRPRASRTRRFPGKRAAGRAARATRPRPRASAP
mmetsp:Transcript_5164/g.15329  ORF Transcript_5164/g.15329 Transcript_5164/m.15329 type:complete len:219 (+) Transcript_5164:201-857(+)